MNTMNTDPQNDLIADLRALQESIDSRSHHIASVATRAIAEIERLRAVPAPVAEGDVLRGFLTCFCRAQVNPPYAANDLTVASVNLPYECSRALGGKPVVILAASDFDKLNRAPVAPSQERVAEREAIALINAERKRQVSAEGWTLAHDDAHTWGEMANAAACYASTGRPCKVFGNVEIKDPPRDWPWDKAWWKPTPDNRVRELVKAGALIVAEIERLQRKETLPELPKELSQGGDDNAHPTNDCAAAGIRVDTPAPSQCQRGAGESPPYHGAQTHAAVNERATEEQQAFAGNRGVGRPLLDNWKLTEPSAEQRAAFLDNYALAWPLGGKGDDFRQAAELLRKQAAEISRLKETAR